MASSDDPLRAAADPLLLPFLREGDAAASDALLGRLLAEHAQPVVGRVIRRKLGVTLSEGDGSARNQDALELASEVGIRLLAELRHLKDDEAGDRRIADFKAYVAVMTYNGCHDYLRRLYPRRWQLRNKLRYLLTHRPRLAIWQAHDRDWLCGLSHWERSDLAEDSDGVDPGARARTVIGAAGGESSFASSPPDRQLEILLFKLGAPIRLDRLVELTAELWQVEDARMVSESETDRHLLADPTKEVDAQISDRSYLERLWTEIRSLPPRQRTALLLNLRDAQGRGVVGLFPLLGVATVRQIAAVLETPADQFAESWGTLPWDDARIGHQLGIERQQVVNLRKAARARLARRMRGW